MKKMMSFIVVALLVGSLTAKAYAHSHLADSNPQDGEVKTESVQDIVIKFDGEIMQGSFIEVTSTEGSAIKVDTIEIGEGQLNATLAEPLPNGEYKVNWSIISADGHPLEGAYSFTVNAPEVNTEPTENNGSEEGQVEEQGNSTETPENTTEPTEDSNMFMYIVIGLAVIVLAVAGLLLVRRKK